MGLLGLKTSSSPEQTTRKVIRPKARTGVSIIPPIEIPDMDTLILEAIYRHKVLSVKTLHTTLAPQQLRQDFYKRFLRLRDYGFIHMPTQKGLPTFVYITPAGARQINQTFRTSGGGHYRPPSAAVLMHHQAQFRLEHLAGSMDLELFEETPPTQGDKQTAHERPGYLALASDARTIEAHQIAQLRASGQPYEMREERLKSGIMLGLPENFRDYYIRAPGRTGAVVLLAKPALTVNFYDRKIEEYAELTKRVPVVALFYVTQSREFPDRLRAARWITADIDKAREALTYALGKTYPRTVSDEQTKRGK